MVTGTRETDTVGLLRNHDFIVVIPKLLERADMDIVVSNLRALLESPVKLQVGAGPVYLTVHFG